MTNGAYTLQKLHKRPQYLKIEHTTVICLEFQSPSYLAALPICDTVLVLM